MAEMIFAGDVSKSKQGGLLRLLPHSSLYSLISAPWPPISRRPVTAAPYIGVITSQQHSNQLRLKPEDKKQQTRLFSSFQYSKLASLKSILSFVPKKCWGHHFAFCKRNLLASLICWLSYRHKSFKTAFFTIRLFKVISDMSICQFHQLCLALISSGQNILLWIVGGRGSTLKLHTWILLLV